MPKPSVIRSDLPVNSHLHKHIGQSDFLDCFSVASDRPPRQAADIITAFPGWTKALVRLRGVLVSPFGLSGSGPDATDKVGLFPVEHESETELIAGFNDRHLDFRVAIHSEAGRVSLATWVHRHNLGGHLYLAAILPFHILIVRNALARLARADGPANKTPA